MANQSPIHAPLEPDPSSSAPAPASPPSPAAARIARIAALDHRPLCSRPYSLGAGGASALFARAVEKALVDEMAEQLREGPFATSNEDSDLRKWAGEIVAAFLEEG